MWHSGLRASVLRKTHNRCPSQESRLLSQPLSSLFVLQRLFGRSHSFQTAAVLWPQLINVVLKDSHVLSASEQQQCSFSN